MTQNLKDRHPVFTGFRSFFRTKYLFSCIVLIALLFFWYAWQLVTVIIPEGDKSPIIFATNSGEGWEIRFTHSVEKTPVDEYFTVNGVNDLTMTHTRFESFGWGFPYSPADGKIKETDDGRFELIMNRPYKSVKMRIAVQARPCIIHEGTVYDLCDMYGQGTLIEIKTMYRYQYWIEHYL